MAQAHFGSHFYNTLLYLSTLRSEEVDVLQGLAKSNLDSEEMIAGDEKLALFLLAQEAEGLLNVVKEHTTEHSPDPKALFSDLIAREALARYDHEVALAIAEDRPIPPKPAILVSHPSHALNLDDESDGSSSEGGSETVQIIEDCTICGEEIPWNAYHAPCGHPYGNNCLHELFRKASRDESLFPPSCCHLPIPLEDVRKRFDNQFVAAFEKKSVEFATKNRVYCFRSVCSAFLGPSTEEPSSLVCQECSKHTCGACKREAHVGQKCGHLETDEVVLALGKEKGWQRCPSCSHLVEHVAGCLYMTCTCKAAFCYLCGKLWKDRCSCPHRSMYH